MATLLVPFVSSWKMFVAAYSCLKRGLFWSIEYCCVLNLTLSSLKALEIPVDMWGGEREKHLKTTELCLLWKGDGSEELSSTVSFLQGLLT